MFALASQVVLNSSSNVVAMAIAGPLVEHLLATFVVPMGSCILSRIHHEFLDRPFTVEQGQVEHESFPGAW